MNPLKRVVSSVAGVTGLSRLALSAQTSWRGPHIRAVNFHDVPAAQAPAFEALLRFLAQHFVNVDRDRLDALYAGRWPHQKPGLLLTFDDGLKSHAEVVAPLLERHGMTGWFMVPAGVLGAPDGGPLTHTVREPTMTWAQARMLAARHVIGCHTFSHRRLAADLTAADLDYEIPQAKHALEAGLDREIDVFTWVGGEESTYSAAAARAIKRAGFRVGFMTNNQVIRPGANMLQLQRTNIEAEYPRALVLLSLSGFFDVLYAAKRRRVNRLTA